MFSEIISDIYCLIYCIYDRLTISRGILIGSHVPFKTSF